MFRVRYVRRHRNGATANLVGAGLDLRLVHHIGQGHLGSRAGKTPPNFLPYAPRTAGHQDDSTAQIDAHASRSLMSNMRSPEFLLGCWHHPGSAPRAAIRPVM